MGKLIRLDRSTHLYIISIPNQLHKKCVTGCDGCMWDQWFESHMMIPHCQRGQDNSITIGGPSQ